MSSFGKIWSIGKSSLQSQGFQQSVITFGGTLLATGISAITIILISRFLGPVEFGIFSLVFAIFSLFIKFGDAGFLYALQKFVPTAQATSTQELHKVLSHITGLRWKLLLLWIPALLFSPLVTWLFKLPAWWIYPSAVIFSLIAIWFEHCMAVFQALHKFVPAMVMFVSQSGLKLLVVGLLLFLGVQSAPVVTVVYYLLPLLVLIPVLFLLKKYLRATFTFDQTFSPRLTQFLRHNSVQVIAIAIADNLDVLIVQLFLGIYATGIYGGISRVAFLFSVLAISLGNVLNIRASRYTLKSDRQAYLRKSWGVVALSAVGCLTVIAIAPWLLQYTIGAEYLVALPEFRILTLSSFLLFMTIPFSSLFYSIEYPQYFSKIGWLLSGTLLLFDLLLIPVFGLMGAAVARVISRVVVMVLTRWEWGKLQLT